ncbi:TonB-dependent receptor [Flavicella marina]|uniref:TonB-dependent receptor n=1 Tax=Flavicella marina TaxID=1475951 RepID=UPI0012656432|nr:TonB-dependent receptor [Flavicella marina]
MKKICLLLIFTSLSVFSQKEKDSVSTEVINVVTSYKPTISDAFKASENPTIDVKSNDRSKTTYKIKSNPIQSVFSPYPGGYTSALTNYKKPGYPDYVKVGFGNYSTPLVEGFLYKQKDEHEGKFFLYNKSSNGGIKDVVLNNNYLNTILDLNYKNTQKKQVWEANVYYQRDLYNWYGIPFTYDNSVSDNIDEKQIYNDFRLTGNIELTQGWFKKSEGSLEKFSDKHGSNESRFYFATNVDFPVEDQFIYTSFDLDILHGEFENDYTNTAQINYGYLSLNAKGKYLINKDDLSLSLGAILTYNSDLENKKNRFFIYPDIHVDYNLINELLTVYGRFTGGIVQNSFRSITSINPYVSPTLNIKPTSNSYKIVAGLKGKITSSIFYDVNASLSREKDKLLFRSNQNLTDGLTQVAKGYQAGNSFYTLYDNATTIELFGQIHALLTENIQTGASLSIFNYNMSTEAEAWNLPPFVGTLFGTYSFGKWATKAEIYAKGKRKDLLIASDGSETLVEVKGYVDINLSADYTFNRKWSAFLELNNVLNTNYQVYSNFQVQGFQVMAGAMYRFDF